MAYENSIISSSAEKNYISLFDSLAGNSILLRNDAPTFTILAATPDYLKESGVLKEDLIGKGVFDVFPENSIDSITSQKKELLTSFELVLTQKKRDTIPVQRYDLKNEDGSFSEKYWNVVNNPVLSSNGEVLYIVHTAENITNKVISERKEDDNLKLKKTLDFFMSAPIIIGLLKGEKYIVEMANENLLEIWQKSPDIVGKELLKVSPEIEAQGLIQILDDVRITGKPFYANEYPLILNRNGKDELLYFDFVYKPIYEEKENKIASSIVCVGHHVTPQVLARNKIEASEAKYRTLFNSIDQGFCIIEVYFNEKEKPVDYQFLEVNPVFEKHNGLQNAEGKRVSELVPDLESHWFEIYGKVVKTGESVRIIEESVALNRWFDVFAFRIGEESQHQVAILFTDITEQKKSEQSIRESEERFRNLADDSPIFVFIIDPDPLGSVNYWNRTWLEYTGQNLEEALGRAWDGIIHPEDIEIVMKYYLPAFTNRESYYIPAVRVKRKDGLFRWHSFKGNPRYLVNGEFNGYVGVGFDIHEQKIAEEALKQSEAHLQVKVSERTIELERTIEELKRSNANLEDFAYAASHDLKEPIRKIHFFSDRLKSSMEDRISEDEKKYFERMETASKRMGNLIDDLLTYSHVTTGIFELQTIDLNKKVHFVLGDLELEIEEKGAIVNVDALPVIKGNKRQIQQMFQNLIGNAIKYSKPGISPEVNITSTTIKGSEAELELSIEDVHKDFYSIEISDNGIGFDPEDADRIFNIFTRLHGNAMYKGTGIGLSIVRKVVENHNGYIQAKGKPDAGATFKVLLPVEK